MLLRLLNVVERRLVILALGKERGQLKAGGNHRSLEKLGQNMCFFGWSLLKKYVELMNFLRRQS